MSSKKTDQASAPLIKPSIDSVLDQGESFWKPYLDTVKARHRPASPDIVTPPPSPPGRPGASTRPSWIGPKPPERPSSPGIANMKHTVTIEYSSPALQPPVFIFTNLSDPQWEAVEMYSEKAATSGEWRFHKAFTVDSGEYQYKFRLGPGDWWVTDESKPVVDDGQGNKNNLLVVKEEEHPSSVEQHASPPKPIDLSSKKDSPSSPMVGNTAAADTVATPAPAHERDEAAVESEVEAPKRPFHIEIPPVVYTAQQAVATPSAAPLMGHELFADHKPVESSMQKQDGQHSTNADEAPRLAHEQEHLGSALEEDITPGQDDADDNDGEDHENRSPLLRHESLSATSAEQEHSPLFQHESASLGAHTGSPKAQSSRRASDEDSIPVEADPEDESLEQFPTSRHEIYERIHHTSLQLPADQTRDHSQDERDPDVTDILVGAGEGDEDNSRLEKLHKIEEEEAEREDEEEGDPLLPAIVLTEANGESDRKGEEFVKREMEEGGQEKRSRIIAELVQTRGPFGTAMDLLRNPLCWVGNVGLALAVVAGWYKLRYA